MLSSGLLFSIFISSLSGQLMIEDQPMVSNNLYEEEGTELELQCIRCSGFDPSDNNEYAIDLVRIEPSFDPCSNCFQVYKNLNNADGRYCLYYLPAIGSLLYERTQTYTAFVICRDSFGNVTDPVDIDIRIRTNEPPFFNNVPSFRGTCNIQAQSTSAGGVVNLSPWAPWDPDNDPIFYEMTTDPEEDMFEIDRASGIIRAKRDLSTFCHKEVSFTIHAEDVNGNRIGPYVATCNINDAYLPPRTSNVNKEISISEDTPVETDIVEPYLRTTPLTPFVTFDIQTNPVDALDYFEIINNPGGQRLRLKKMLDFESPVTQTVNITLFPRNGFCEAVPHYIYIRTTDANDPPILRPKNFTDIKNEGQIVVNPNWDLTEQDAFDRNFYSIEAGNEDGLWKIDISTGVISSASEIDIDTKTKEKNWTLVVQVKDLEGEIDNATVVIVVQDSNDNPPVIENPTQTVTLMDCDTPSSIGTPFTVTDKDSDFRDNDVYFFQPVSNEFIEIFRDGSALVKSVPPLGTSSSLSTFAFDQGEFPGPLRSVFEATVIVTTIPCTTTQPTTQAATVDNNVNSNSSSDSSANANANANANTNTFAGLNSRVTSGTNSQGSGVGDIILWALAGLLGLLLIAALTYFIWRYCARFCTGSSSWSDGCGCNRASTPRHIRPFSHQRNYSRQKEDFKSTKKEVEEEEIEEEEEVVQAPAQPPIVYGNSMVPQNKVQGYLKVRRIVPVKPKAVKVRSLVPVPPNYPGGAYRALPQGTGVPPPGPPSNLASYQPAPGLPTGINTKPVQGGVNAKF